MLETVGPILLTGTIHDYWHASSLTCCFFLYIYICKKWIWFFSFEAFFWKTNRFVSLILVILGLSAQSVGHWARHQTPKSSDRQAAGESSGGGVLATRGVFSCGRLVAKHWVIFNSKSVFSIKQVFLDYWRKTKEQLSRCSLRQASFVVKQLCHN